MWLSAIFSVGTGDCYSSLTSHVKPIALSQEEILAPLQFGFSKPGGEQWASGGHTPSTQTMAARSSNWFTREGMQLLSSELMGQISGGRAGLLGPNGKADSTRWNKRSFREQSDTGLRPCAADRVFEARMFPYCLFDHRPRMRNVKQTTSRPREAFLEITQRKKVYIYKNTSFAPNWTLRRTLAITFSSQHSKGNIQRRGKAIFNVESLQM